MTQSTGKFTVQTAKGKGAYRTLTGWLTADVAAHNFERAECNSGQRKRLVSPEGKVMRRVIG